MTLFKMAINYFCFKRDNVSFLFSYLLFIYGWNLCSRQIKYNILRTIKINLQHFMEYVEYMVTGYLFGKDKNLMFGFDIKRKYNYCKNILLQSKKKKEEKAEVCKNLTFSCLMH